MDNLEIEARVQKDSHGGFTSTSLYQTFGSACFYAKFFFTPSHGKAHSLKIEMGSDNYTYLSCPKDPTHFVLIKKEQNSKSTWYHLGERVCMRPCHRKDDIYYFILEAYPSCSRARRSAGYIEISPDFSLAFFQNIECEEIGILDIREEKVLWKLSRYGRDSERYTELKECTCAYFSEDNSKIVLSVGQSFHCFHVRTGVRLCTFDSNNLRSYSPNCDFTDVRVFWRQNNEICLIEFELEDKTNLCIGKDQWGIDRIFLQNYGEIRPGLGHGYLQLQQTEDEIVYGDKPISEGRFVGGSREDFIPTTRPQIRSLLHVEEERLSKICYRNLTTGEIRCQLIHPLTKLTKDGMEWILIRARGTISCFVTETRLEIWRFADEESKILDYTFYPHWSRVILIFDSYLLILDMSSGESIEQIRTDPEKIFISPRLPYFIIQGEGDDSPQIRSLSGVTPLHHGTFVNHSRSSTLTTGSYN